MVGQIENDVGVISGSPVGVVDLGSTKDVTRKGKSRSGHDRRQHGDEVLVVQSHLGDVGSHVLDFGVGCCFGQSNVEEACDGGVADDPVQCLQHVPFHLRKHVVVVERAAHGLEFLDGGHTLLAVAVLGGDEK